MTTHNLYTVSNTIPTSVTAGKDDGFDITIQNVNSTGYIYIGGEGVSLTNYGFKLSPHQAFSVELPGTDDLYIIADTDGLSASVLYVAIERSF